MKLLFFGTPASQNHNIDRLAVDAAARLNQYAEVKADLLDLYSIDLPGAQKQVENIRASGTELMFLEMPCRRVRSIAVALCRVLTTAWKLRKILREGEYDCVETDSSNHVASLAAALACLTLSTTHVMGIHGDYAKRKWIPRRGWNALALCALRLGTHFYGVSKQVVWSWPQASATSANRTRLIYNAIHDDFFSVKPDRLQLRKEINVPANARLLLYAGRIVPDKGIMNLLDALPSLFLRCDAYLLLVGQTPDYEFLQKVRHRMATEPWGRRVRLLGQREDIPRFMMSSDVLVLPTLWEGFGLVLAEALACGLPIVATNVGGIPEILADTHELMVTPGDPQALSRAIESVLERQPTEVALFAAAARESSLRFTLDRRAADLLRLFADVIGSKSRSLTLAFPKPVKPEQPPDLL